MQYGEPYTNGKTLRIIKNTVNDIGKNFSQRSDKIADICLENSQGGRAHKAKRIGKETVSLFKNIGAETKGHLKELKLKSILRDTSYGIGKASATAFSSGAKFIKSFTK